MPLFLQALLAQAPDVPAFSVADAVKAIQGGQSQANYLLLALIGTAGFGLTTGQPQPELIASLINALLAGLTSVGLWEMLGKPVANRIPEKPQE